VGLKQKTQEDKMTDKISEQEFNKLGFVLTTTNEPSEEIYEFLAKSGLKFVIKYLPNHARRRISFHWAWNAPNAPKTMLINHMIVESADDLRFLLDRDSMFQSEKLWEDGNPMAKIQTRPLLP
jgi:hypothetical protein